MLNINNITVQYGNKNPSIVNLSMDMKPGEIVSIVGESGSGKTTLIRSIMGLLPAGGKITNGDIVFNGKSLLAYSMDDWNKIRGTELSMIFKLLIADEPTSALDVTTQSQIIRNMLELREKFNTGIIMVTHNLAIAAYISDKIIVMKDGKIVEQGSRDNIINNPKDEYTKELLNSVSNWEEKLYV